MKRLIINIIAFFAIISISSCSDDDEVKIPDVMPEINAGKISDVEFTSVKLSCSIKSFGSGAKKLTALGVVCSREKNSTFDDKKAINKEESVGEKTECSFEIKNLLEGTNYFVRIYYRNEEGLVYSPEITFKTKKSCVAELITLNASLVGTTIATIGGNVVSEGLGSLVIKAAGVVYSEAKLPKIGQSGAVKSEKYGVKKGEYSFNIVNLKEKTTYYYCAYAISSSSEISYADVKSFTTTDANVPTLETIKPSMVEFSNATLNGRVISIGTGSEKITHSGFVYSEFDKPVMGEDDVYCVEEKNSKKGSFSYKISALKDNTQYFVRAYAKTAKSIVYGLSMVFSTKKYDVPVVTTGSASIIYMDSAILRGEVTHIGSGQTTILKVGMMYSEREDIMMGGDGIKYMQADQTNDDDLYVPIRSLKENTTYYYCAYAFYLKNPDDENYSHVTGEIKSFKTSEPNLPRISLDKISDVELNTATLSGHAIKGNGSSRILSKGFVYSENPVPTIGGDGVVEKNGFRNSEMSFSVKLSELKPGVKYYARAYVKYTTGYNSSVVEGIRYSFIKEFTTINAQEPEITTGDPRSVDYKSAIVSGNLTKQGTNDYIVVSRGIVYCKDDIPYVNKSYCVVKEESVSDLGEFSYNISDLKGSYKYNVRAFVKTASGKYFYGMLKTFYTKSFTKMIKVSSGSFSMGSDEISSNPIHNVTLTRSFEMAEVELTNKKYIEIMGGVAPSENTRDEFPLTNISWNQVQSFIRALNKKTGRTYRLPTEAEWEYVAGGGKYNRTMYSGTDKFFLLSEYAICKKRGVYPVKSLKPNALGFYDMSGNVEEWCSDCGGGLTSKDVVDPKGAKKTYNANHIVKGGSWHSDWDACRVASRFMLGQSDTDTSLGLRLVREL